MWTMVNTLGECMSPYIRKRGCVCTRDCMCRVRRGHWQRRGRDVHHKGVGGDRGGWGQDRVGVRVRVCTCAAVGRTGQGDGEDGQECEHASVHSCVTRGKAR